MNAEPSPAVSVVIAAKDSLHYLRDFVPPILEQLKTMGGGSELIVFDDGSTDGTADALAAEMPQVRVVRSEKNIGYVRARNRAFAMAANEIILSLDSDIRILDHFIQEAVRPMADPDVFAVACRCMNMTRDRRTETLTHGFFDRGLLRIAFPGLVGEPQNDAKGPVLTAPGGISAFRKSIFLEVGGFDEMFYPGYGGEDVDYSYRVRKRGYRLAYASQAAAEHLHRGTMKNLYDERTISNIYQRNLLMVTWKLISDRGLLLRHLAGLPRMLLSVRQAKILCTALRRLPRVLLRRYAEKPHWVRADAELLAGVYESDPVRTRGGVGPV